MFEKARKKDSFLKIAVTGPSGSGKTFGSLGLASCLGKKIAVIDTENGSASLYCDKFDFDVVNISPPYEIKKYVEAINAAVEGGYQVVVIDSLSHGWAGSGGLLDKKSALDSTGKGNSYTNWGQITKEHELMISAILHSKIHLIATMRSKQGYSMEEGANGKKTVRKVGMEAIQRDGVEYEFTTVFDLSMSHHAQVSKDRTALFGTDEVFKLDKRIGTALLNWINSEPKKETKPTVENISASLHTQKEPEAPNGVNDTEPIPDFGSFKDESPATKIDFDSVGEIVMNAGVFAGTKIKDAWNLNKEKSVAYAAKIHAALVDHEKVSPKQVMFVDYAVHKKHLPEKFIEGLV